MRDYYGTYNAALPVAVKNTKPSAALVTSSFAVAKEYDRSGNINLDLSAKNELSLSELQSAEIIGKNSSFIISSIYLGVDNNRVIRKGKTYQYDNTAIVLSPKNAITKAETVQIKLTYANTKAIKGKPYSTILKVKIKPISKFLITPVSKTVTVDPMPYPQEDGEFMYDTAVISFKKTPSNYTGASFVVTGYDGLEVSAPDQNTGEFKVHATSDLKNTKNGQTLTVKWVDDSTNKKLAETKVTVKFKEGQKSEIKTTKATIRLDKNAVYFNHTGVYRYVAPNESTITSTADNSVYYSEGQFCAQATIDQMKVPINLKESGTASYSGELYVDDNRFQAGLWQLKKDKVVWAPYIQPTIMAVQKNMLKPGEEITTNLTRVDRLGNTTIQSIKIKIADIKSVKTVANAKMRTLYKKAPYYEAAIGIKPLAPAFDRIVNVTANDPNYTVRIQSAQSTIKTSGYDKENFEKVYLGYTNHNSTKITGKTYQKPINLTLAVTYASGKTGTVKVKLINK